MILGLLVTTDGTWRGHERTAVARRAGDLVDRGALPLAKGLVRVPTGRPRVRREVSYREWTGRVWVEVIAAADQGGKNASA